MQPKCHRPPGHPGYQGQHDRYAFLPLPSGLIPGPKHSPPLALSFVLQSGSGYPSLLQPPPTPFAHPFLPSSPLYPISLQAYIGTNDTVNAQQQSQTLEVLQTYGTDHVSGITIGNEYVLDSTDQTTAVEYLVAQMKAVRRPAPVRKRCTCETGADFFFGGVGWDLVPYGPGGFEPQQDDPGGDGRRGE